MNVPLLDLKAQNSALEPELHEAFARVLRSGQFIQGAEVEKLEQALAAFTGARHALGVSSGTDALLLLLMAAGIGPGDEVLCPTFTFFATAGCVARLGAKPVFVDSLAGSFNLDPADAARRVTEKTKAIIPVHLFGQCADMDAMNALAAQHGLWVIEDAAQSLGATYHGRASGTMGHAGATSFFPSKNLGGFGDGGALVTNDDALYARAKILRMHGMEPKYFHAVVGGNFRLDALQAALLSVKLPHLADYSAARRRNAEKYAELLGLLPAVAAGELILPAIDPGNESIWNQYTVRVTAGRDKRDALRTHLATSGIGAEIYYPLPLHEQGCFNNLGYQPEDFPVAHRLAGEVLSLPVYPELEPAGLEEVCSAVARFFGERLI